MSTLQTGGFGAELRDSVQTAIDLVRQVTDVDEPWETPYKDSPAGVELLAEEERNAETTGSWPWLMASMVARWALWIAIDEASALRHLIDLRTTSYGADVLCRSVLESSSLAWWLLDPDTDAEQRLSRVLLYRYNTAKETEKAARHIGLGRDEDRSAYGETPDTVAKEARALGFEIARDRNRLVCGDTVLPRYSERAASLVEMMWPQRKLPYALLSAVAHAELLGLTRNLAELPRALRAPGDKPSTIMRPAPDQEGIWLWQDTYLVSGALLLGGERAAVFLGDEHQAGAIASGKRDVQQRLTALRPELLEPEGA